MQFQKFLFALALATCSSAFFKFSICLAVAPLFKFFRNNANWASSNGFTSLSVMYDIGLFPHIRIISNGAVKLIGALYTANFFRVAFVARPECLTGISVPSSDSARICVCLYGGLEMNVCQNGNDLKLFESDCVNMQSPTIAPLQFRIYKRRIYI